MSARDWRKDWHKRKAVRVPLTDEVESLLAAAANDLDVTPSQAAEHLLSEMAFLLRHDLYRKRLAQRLVPDSIEAAVDERPRICGTR